MYVYNKYFHESKEKSIKMKNAHFLEPRWEKIDQRLWTGPLKKKLHPAQKRLDQPAKNIESWEPDG
jgi:hypothetical protein